MIIFITRIKPPLISGPAWTDVGTRTAHGALRFEARLASARADDSGARLDEGTLSAFEGRAPNSGHAGGCFLERTRVPLPRAHGGALADAGGGGFYDAHHLAVGEVLELFGRRLALTAADGFTERYLGTHADEISARREAEARAAAAKAAKADADAAAAEAAQAEDAAARGDLGGGGVQTMRVDRLEKALRTVLLARSGQLRTVFRRIDRNADGRITLSEFATLLAELHFELEAEVRAGWRASEPRAARAARGAPTAPRPALRPARHFVRAAQEVAALMHRFDKHNDGYISFDSFCEAVIPKDHGPPGLGGPARPSTAPPMRELATDELLRSYARTELDASDSKAVDRMLARLRTAFEDRGARLAVIFRELDTGRTGARAVRRGAIASAASDRPRRRRRAAPPAVRRRRAGSLGHAEFREAFSRHNIKVADRDFALLMRALKRHSEREDGRVEYATFGALLGRQ